MGVSQSNADISSYGIRAGLACFNGCDRQTICHFLYVFVFDHAFIKGITLRRNLDGIFRQDEDMVVDDDLSFVFIEFKFIIRLLRIQLLCASPGSPPENPIFKAPSDVSKTMP